MERRKKLRLKTFYKTLHGEAPLYLQEVLPAQLRENNQYILRNEDNFPQIRSRTSTFQNSFFPKTIQDWNNLSNATKASDTVNTFTRKLHSNLDATPKWFYSGERLLSVKHAKLRMLCSNLNDHLYSHIHVIESPMCPCGHIRENNRHFLIDCMLYNVERNIMFAKLQEIGFEPNLNNLLYGNSDYSLECNLQAFDIIQEYIQSTGRL